MNVTPSNPDSQMMREVSKLNAEKKGYTKDEEIETTAEETLPGGAEPVAGVEAQVEAAPAETPEVTEPAADEPEEPIRINGQEFKNQKEAFAYAEQLAREKDIADAHAQGVREALEAQRAQAPAQPPEEEDFDAKFYANPKEALKDVQVRARDEALAVIRLEQQREKAWNEFLAENPDIRKKDAERILFEDQVLQKMTDLDKAKKLLAQKVRAEYAEIAEMIKPRTQLADKKQTLAPSGGPARGVTPPKKEEKILSLAEQMRTLRKN